jgi:O-antigen/teichoic acid export membrane protein
MHKKFLTNAAILIFLNLLIKPFWLLGIDRIVQVKVGPADYGMYYALFNLTILFNIILDFGITNFNNKNIAQNNHLLNKHLSSILLIKGILMVAYFAIMMSAAVLLGYRGYELGLLAVLGFNMFLNYFILYLRSNLAGLHLFKTDSVISVLDRMLMILFCGIFLWNDSTADSFNIEWFVLIQTACYVITAIVTFIIVMNKASFKRLRWNVPFFLMILRKSFPFAVLVLLMTFYNRLDAVMIERMLRNETGAFSGDVQSGIYASSYRLLDAANMIAYLLAAILLPMFARMIKHKENVEELVKISSMLLLAPAVVVAATCFFYSEEIMTLLYAGLFVKHPDYLVEAAAIFRVLMLCFAAFASTYIFGTLLTANGSLKQLNIMALFGIVLNLGLNWYLIPTEYAYGSAKASLITQFVLATVQVVMAVYIFKMRINVGLLLRFGAFALAVGSLTYYSKMLTDQWMFNMGVAIAGSGVLVFATGLVNIKQIFSLFAKQ